MKKRILFLASLLIGPALAAEPLAPIQATGQPPTVKVACIGDSITEGMGASEGMSYPSQLQAYLGTKWQVLNFGVSGRTLLKKGDFPYWKEAAYQAALKSEPNVVIIMLGTNDSKPHNWKFESEFVPDYTDLVKSFQTLGSKPRVYLCRPCPVPEPGNFGINEDTVKEEIKRIDKLAKDLNLPIIDMHKALKTKPEMLPDRVHPNTEGAAEMAKAAFKALTGQPTPAAAKK